MKGLTSRIIWGRVFAVLVMVGLGLYADVQALLDSFALFDWTYLLPALALALGNYLVRFVRWHLYLKEVQVAHRVPVLESLAIFTAGLVMSITPGKVGELLKSVMLKERRGVPIPTRATVVVAERLTDFVAVLLLCLGVYLSSSPTPGGRPALRHQPRLHVSRRARVRVPDQHVRYHRPCPQRSHAELRLVGIKRPGNVGDKLCLEVFLRAECTRELEG